MDELDSLRLALDAERHAHRQDNEYLLGELNKLRAQMRGVFCVNTQAAPPPGPPLDTPAQRLAAKRGQISLTADEAQRSAHQAMRLANETR